MATSNGSSPKLHKNEGIKTASNFLRGTLAESLADPLTGDVAPDDAQLTKFHGIYVQDDRDLRAERRKQKLDRAYSFMIRVRVPGGIATPQQWLDMDRLADQYGNGTMKLTTRQAFQLHGILKGVLKKTIQEINTSLMDTIAACGDVNRNVMCNPNPHVSEQHAAAQDLAQAISDHLTPRTRAYHEIWLDEERVAGGPEDEEPIYGKTYLPRKFKTVVAVPPSNDVDIFAHDLGFILIDDGNGGVAGYNVTVGGGLGMTHGNAATFPRVADVMSFCTRAQALQVAEAVVKAQRDHGDRTNRAHARLKYTIADHGLDWFRAQVETHLDFKLEPPRPFTFTDRGDRYGWVDGTDGKQHLTLFIENGRIADYEGYPLKTGLREIAKIHTGDFRLTCNQGLVLGGVTPEKRPEIEALLQRHGLQRTLEGTTGLRKNAMACVALPTCGLALAESERYLPKLIDALDEVVERAGLRDDAIAIRMTGCPNGCARPYLGEIGMVGKAPGRYNLYLGAGFDGARLARLYKSNVKEEELVGEIGPLIQRYATERENGEKFGDFVHRVGLLPEWQGEGNYHEPAIGPN